jgi:hypothetical protein
MRLYRGITKAKSERVGITRRSRLFGLLCAASRNCGMNAASILSVIRAKFIPWDEICMADSSEIHPKG